MQSLCDAGAEVVRNSGDILDTWSSVSEAAKDALTFRGVAGCWPDPDMLQISAWSGVTAGGLSCSRRRLS
jgi:hypothetical protein